MAGDPNMTAPMSETQDAALAQLLEQVSGAEPVRRWQADLLPAAPGAYLLLLRLDRPLRPPIPRLPSLRLKAGSYVYAGSAYGAGGIAARVRRHLGRGKRVHWHIDHLTEAASGIVGFPSPGGLECVLLQRLLQSGRLVPAAKGFGSSDCRTCESHLLADFGKLPEPSSVV